MQTTGSFPPVLWAVAGLLALPGCGGSSGPQRANAAGKVTFDGQPVEQGAISFAPMGNTTGPSSGGEIIDGHYSIARAVGPVVGTHRVEIQAMRRTGRQIESGPPAPPGTMVDEVEQFIPAKYNSQSELTAEISAGKNTVHFELATGR